MKADRWADAPAPIRWTKCGPCRDSACLVAPVSTLGTTPHSWAVCCCDDHRVDLRLLPFPKRGGPVPLATAAVDRRLVADARELCIPGPCGEGGGGRRIKEGVLEIQSGGWGWGSCCVWSMWLLARTTEAYERPLRILKWRAGTGVQFHSS